MHGKEVILVEEIEFAKALAGNYKILRDRGIKKLRKWLMARSIGKYEFTDDDFLRIWKGIFYCMWMADKLLVQLLFHEAMILRSFSAQKYFQQESFREKIELFSYEDPIYLPIIIFRKNMCKARLCASLPSFLSVSISYQYLLMVLCLQNEEELAETISNLIHCFKKTDLTVSFIRCFFHTMVLEWYGIDQFRYDKFLMLVRRFLRQSFKFCRNCQWQEEVVVGVCNAFSLTVLSPSKSGSTPPPVSLVLHFCDIYIQELAKVGEEKIPHDVVTAFLQPFITLLSVQENGIVRSKVVKDVFHYLMKQSDAALEFTEKWKAWKSAGCPGESWEDMEKVEEEEEMYCEDTDPSEKEMLENEPLDPRAGSVDVELPQIPFDSQHVAEAIQLEIEKCTSRKHCKALQDLAQKFLEFDEGKYPLAKSEEKNILTRPRVEKFKLKNHINKALFRLNSFERKVGKRNGKRRPKRKNKQKTTSQSHVLVETMQC